MTHVRYSVSLTLCVSALVALNACVRGESDRPAAVADSAPVADSASVARARMAADSLGPALMSKLIGAIESGGPESAVAFCSDAAQALTARFSHDGVQIRRVGTRVRNALNAPDTLEQRMLQLYEAERVAGRPLAERSEVAHTGPNGGWELRMFRPITLLDRCVACHGTNEQISPAVRTLLATRYPDDKAVGYAPGDLRGAISVRVPLPSAPQKEGR